VAGGRPPLTKSEEERQKLRDEVNQRQLAPEAASFKSLYLKRPFTAHRNDRSSLVGASDTALRLVVPDPFGIRSGTQLRRLELGDFALVAHEGNDRQ
jgi:hypothetical protein